MVTKTKRMSNKEVKRFIKFAGLFAELQLKVHESFKNVNGQCEG
jgi:hypothetical protein